MDKKPDNEFRFTLDAHLGKLAKLLRLFGFDSFFDADFDDEEIVVFSRSRDRIILTRDKELLRNRKVMRGYRILSQYPEEQLREVFKQFDLKDHIKPFTRCLECNSLLNEVRKEDIAERLSDRTLKYYNTFLRCSGCDRIYWEGSHYERMRKYIDSVIKNVN